MLGSSASRLAFYVRRGLPRTPVNSPSYKDLLRGFHASARAAASKKDLYETLGVPKTATKSDVKKNYSKLAKQYHPDTNKDPKAAEKFAEIQNAYEILSDDSKKEAYDQHGHAAFDQSMGGGPGGPGEGFVNAEDIFEQFFGGMGGGGRAGRRGRSQRRGGDVQTTLRLSFMEAANGCKKSVSTVVDVPCAPCAGTGSADKSAPTTCSACNGTGQVTRAMEGFMVIASTCRKCGGEGTLNKNPCRPCGGSGTVKSPRSVEVRPPSPHTGLKEKRRLHPHPRAAAGRGPSRRRHGHQPPPAKPGRCGGEERSHGAPLRAGLCGCGGGAWRCHRVHLCAAPSFPHGGQIQVESDPFFERDGADVHVTVPLTLSQAVLGAVVTVPTISGEVRTASVHD